MSKKLTKCITRTWYIYEDNLEQNSSTLHLVFYFIDNIVIHTTQDPKVFVLGNLLHNHHSLVIYRYWVQKSNKYTQTNEFLFFSFPPGV